MDSGSRDLSQTNESEINRIGYATGFGTAFGSGI